MAYMTWSKTEVGLTPAPTVASFSSRGPNSIDEFILKVWLAFPALALLTFSFFLFIVFNMRGSAFNLSLTLQHQE